MTNLFNALEFASMSAAGAIDQKDAYTDSVASFRENLVDTLTDEKVDAVTYDAAMALYARLTA